MFYIQGNNIEMTRGDTLHAVINMRDPLGVISYPETGDVVTFNAMLTRDGEAVITKTIPHDTMTLTLDPEDTEELAYGRYIFTVKIVRAGGDVDTFIDDGTLTLVKTWRHKPHDAYVPWNPWIPLNSMNGWLAPGGAAPVDAALNISSDHPVQNKVLYQALAGKVDKVEGMGLSHNDLTDALAQKLTDIETGATKTIVDALFVSGSTNPVQSKTIQAALAAKVDKEVGKGLSSNDYTSAEKEKLSGIEAGAQKNPDLSGYALKSEIHEAKQALLTLLAHVAYTDDQGQTYLDALETALYPPVDLLSISAVFNQGDVVIYDTDELDVLKQYLTVTANMSDGTTQTVSNYTLSGTLMEGTSTITVSYGGKTDTFTATVTWGYKLRNAFSSTGETAVDTGIVLESDNTYTIKGDFTLTGINTYASNHTADFIFSNKIANNSTYIGLQVIKESRGAKHNYMWGVGIGYSAGDELAVLNNQYRFVLTIDVANLSCSITLKNVTSGVANTYTNTYAADAFANGKAIFLGNGEGGSVNAGFIGTISDFEIALGAMSSSDISDYLAG